jgi:signal transduction histidine kinase/CheY-like chemotaxis protein
MQQKEQRPKGWMAAALPENEAARLRALRRYDILDTLPEEAFDRITRLASAILKTPIALISLVDEKRQWFKSHHGIDATETPREMAFCAHAILQDEVLVVPDVARDARFQDNPLVTGKPDIRFYAGAPLVTPDGYALGTLCVIDQQLHAPLSEQDRAVLKDLAALVIDEMELRVAGQNAIVASQAKSKFLANMSHEIRTPMNAILGYATMLLDSELTLDQKDQVNTIKRSGEALLDIINDVLDISKIEAGRLELTSISFSLRNVVEEVLSLFSLKAAEKFVPLMVEYRTEVPPGFVGDPGRIRQVLINLVGNALKFTHTGHVKVIVSYDASHGRIHCEVEDTGIGIKQEYIDKIFEDFTQVDMSVTRLYGGTGLGLAICRRLLEMMGGSMEVRSVVGSGTSVGFTLILPVDDAHVQGENATKAPIDAPIKAHVLVVEDLLFNQKVARYTLEKIGCSVDIASSGREALKMIEGAHYDAVFMDMQMPEMDGMQVTRTIRAREDGKARQTVIAMTASALPEDKEMCLGSGMDDFISKTLQPHLVRAVLRKYVKPAD